jgi:hypothetical protein
VKFFTLTIFAGSRYDLLMMDAGLSNQWAKCEIAGISKGGAME